MLGLVVPANDHQGTRWSWSSALNLIEGNSSLVCTNFVDAVGCFMDAWLLWDVSIKCGDSFPKFWTTGGQHRIIQQQFRAGMYCLLIGVQPLYRRLIMRWIVWIQLELIKKNILSSFGLDDDGQETGQVQKFKFELWWRLNFWLTALEAGSGPPGRDWWACPSCSQNHYQRGVRCLIISLKSRFDATLPHIEQAISRKQYEDFTSLTFAALSGDVDSVRDLLRKGVDIDGVNYDGRSAFAMVKDGRCSCHCKKNLNENVCLSQACSKGNFRVVELLLDEGVNMDTLSRWNISPFQEALFSRW